MDIIYDLRLNIEELRDGGDYKYMGTSPDLPNLIVAGDSIDEVLGAAPSVARALIEIMREQGQPMPSGLTQARQPLQTHILVPA